MLLADVDAAEAESGGPADDVDGEVLGLVPGDGVRGEVFLGEVEGDLGEGELVLGERGHRAHPIVGMVKLAASLAPEGQREVTVLVRV